MNAFRSFRWPLAALLIAAMALLTVNVEAQALPKTPIPGVTVMTAATPWGQAVIAERDGLAVLNIAGLTFAPVRVEALPNLPGMEEATVSTTLCIETHHGHPGGPGGVVILVRSQTFSATGTIGGAAAKVAAQIAALPPTSVVVPCGPTQG